MQTRTNITVQPGIYRHYKGNLYRVIGVAAHSETEEGLVVYEALYNNPRSRLWVRPASMFIQNVEVDGKPQPRFEYVAESQHASVGVGVLILKDEKVLLIKRTGSHGEGTWSSPGGHIDFGETIEETAVRETKEETGIDITRIKFKAITNDVFPDDGKHYITIWVQGDYAEGNPTIQSTQELTDLGWFSWSNLPSPLFIPLQNLVSGKHYPTAPLRL
jgi:8-oxo-dGTP diphosphatase